MFRWVLPTVLLLHVSASAATLNRAPFAALDTFLSQVSTGPLRIAGDVTQAVESTRLKMLAAIARGDIQSAIVLWQAHTGAQVVPGWLRAFQAAFNASNQRAGPCMEVAKSVFDGFRRLGKQPTYIRFTSEGTQRGSNLLAFEIRAGEPRSTIQISENYVHYAVKVEDRIYDAFTGPRGLEGAEYAKRLFSLGKITTETVSELP